MQKLRILPLAAISLALSLFTGCDDSTDAPKISGFGVSNAKVDAPKNINLTGSVEFGTDDATISYTVSPSTGITPPASYVSKSSPASLAKDQIQIDATANGTYTVTITVKDADGQTTTAQTSFCVGSCGTSSGTKLGDNAGLNTVELGAQNAAAGSFLNADGFEVFKSDSDKNGYKTAAQKQSIDVVFFASSAGVPTFYAPTAAASAGLGGIASWGSDAKSTIIVDAGTSPITTKEGAMAAIGSQTSTQAAVVSGHYYALKLSNGKYAVINAIIGGSGMSATATVDILSE